MRQVLRNFPTIVLVITVQLLRCVITGVIFVTLPCALRCIPSASTGKEKKNKVSCFQTTSTDPSVWPLLLQILHDFRVCLHEPGLKGRLIGVQTLRYLPSINQNRQKAERKHTIVSEIEQSVILRCEYKRC